MICSPSLESLKKNLKFELVYHTFELKKKFGIFVRPMALFLDQGQEKNAFDTRQKTRNEQLS